MAEGRTQKCSERLSHSLLMSSDVLIDIPCDICCEDGRQVEAEGFCVDCSDYLCRECCKAHGKTKMSRHHQLQSKTSMPKQRPGQMKVGVKSGTGACTESCEHHPDRITEYYCKDHRQMGCTVCMTVNHRTCKGVDHIPDLAQGLLQSQEYRKFEKELADLKEGSIQVIKDSKENLTYSKRCSSAAVQNVLDLQKDMNSLFDSLVDNIKQQSETSTLDDLKKMKIVEGAGNKVLVETEKIASNVDVLKRTNQLCKLFTLMKKNENELKRLRETLDETESKNTVKDYFFEPSVDIQSILNGLTSVGKFCTQSSAAVATTAKTTDPQYVTAELVEEISLGGDSIRGIAVLPGSKIVVAELGGCVKLIDLRTTTVTSELYMEVALWDLTIVSGKQVATTAPRNKHIVIVKIAKGLKKERSIDVEGECRCICSCNEKLFVTFVSPTNFVAVMDLNGAVERKIGMRDIKPEYSIAYESISQNIYLSDGHSVMCFTLGGTKRFSLNTDWVAGIAVDQSGRIFACGDICGNITVFNSSLSKAKILAEGLVMPTSLGYCQQTKKLYVGSRESKVDMYVFQLS